MTRKPTTLVLLAALSIGCGCANKNRKWTPPEADAGAPVTADQLAKQVAKASELTRDAQRNELAGKIDRAEELYRAAIAEYRETPVAWHNLGILLAKRQQNVAAAEAFKTASELSPTDPRPLYSLGVLWEDLGYLDDAARWYDEALQRDPGFQSALRRSVLVDDLRGKLSQTTAERVKRAILAEREPWWINRFKRIQQRMRDPRERANMEAPPALPGSGSQLPPTPPAPDTTPITLPDTRLSNPPAHQAPAANPKP